jgi:hypothetical protein
MTILDLSSSSLLAEKRLLYNCSPLDKCYIDPLLKPLKNNLFLSASKV